MNVDRDNSTLVFVLGLLLLVFKTMIMLGVTHADLLLRAPNDQTHPTLQDELNRGVHLP